MKKVIFICFLLAGCTSSTDQLNNLESSKDSIVLNKTIDPITVLENEIINKPNSPNVYYKRAIFIP